MKSNLLQREVAYEQEARLNEQIEAYWDERSGDFSRLRLKELSGPCGAAWSGVLAEKLPAKSLRVPLTEGVIVCTGTTTARAAGESNINVRIQASSFFTFRPPF